MEGNSMTKKLLSALGIALVFWLWHAGLGFGTDYVGPIINTHTQYDHRIEIDEVIRIVKKARISKIILSGRGKRTNEDVIAATKAYPNTVFPAARTKFGYYIKGSFELSSF